MGPITKIAVLIFAAGLLSASPAVVFAADELDIIGDTHTIASFVGLDGPASRTGTGMNSFDMTLFEASLGGKQTLLNGSGITTNTSYPLTEGNALTNNTHIGLSRELTDGMKAGFLVGLYSNIGRRSVGRTYGDELPWDNFSREEGAVQPTHFEADLYNAFVDGRQGNWSYRLKGGVLPAKDSPEFAVKESNQVRLGSLVWRSPITNASLWSKEDHRLVEGRQSTKGFDLLVDNEVSEKRHLRFELFSAATEPTPINDLERDAYGGHASLDVLDGNIGFTYVYNDGLRPVTGTHENEGIWSVDASYKVTDAIVPYAAFAQSDYERKSLESHSGDAIAAGVLFKAPGGHELKAQFQRADENYELMAIHKPEHYPSNFQGLNAQGTIVLTSEIKIKPVVYYLEQIETATSSSDTIFGDPYFPSIAGSDKGTVAAERLAAEWKVAAELFLSGYAEHAKFRKSAATAAVSIDKDVYNFYGVATLNLTKEFYVEGGLRHVFSVGNWQAMNFRSFQQIPEAAIGYKIDKDHRATLLYNYYEFEDNNAASRGENDYRGHMITFEVRTLL